MITGMIELAPRPLSDDNWGYWCYRCKTDLGGIHETKTVGLVQATNTELKQIIRAHLRKHRIEMRNQL